MRDGLEADFGFFAFAFGNFVGVGGKCSLDEKLLDEAAHKEEKHRDRTLW